jgi:hypothetical protein
LCLGMTSQLQPCDTHIFAPLKQHMKKTFNAQLANDTTYKFTISFAINAMIHFVAHSLKREHIVAAFIALLRKRLPPTALTPPHSKHTVTQTPSHTHTLDKGGTEESVSEEEEDEEDEEVEWESSSDSDEEIEYRPQTTKRPRMAHQYAKDRQLAVVLTGYAVSNREYSRDRSIQKS